jgi:hypothetical protein
MWQFFNLQSSMILDNSLFKFYLKSRWFRSCIYQERECLSLNFHASFTNFPNLKNCKDALLCHGGTRLGHCHKRVPLQQGLATRRFYYTQVSIIWFLPLQDVTITVYNYNLIKLYDCNT